MLEVKLARVRSSCRITLNKLNGCITSIVDTVFTYMQAYSTWLERHKQKDRRLPGVYFTNKQLFFINFAQVCFQRYFIFKINEIQSILLRSANILLLKCKPLAEYLPRLEKRALILLLSINHNFVVSVRRGFLFLLVLRIGCIILLWHALGFPYNYFFVFFFLRLI